MFAISHKHDAKSLYYLTVLVASAINQSINQSFILTRYVKEL